MVPGSGKPPDGVFRVGGGVTPPEPQYTEEDRNAGLEGTVTLYAHINAEGKAVNIRVLHSLSEGLDQQAIEAVQHWQFTPGRKNGEPVTVEAQIEVKVHLKKDPGQGGN